MLQIRIESIRVKQGQLIQIATGSDPLVQEGKKWPPKRRIGKTFMKQYRFHMSFLVKFLINKKTY
jgi:hypothetical protein